MTQRILVTSALPYINGIKHLGNLAGSLLPADVHARFHRQVGDEVLFVCGTDEHGTPAELAAAAAGEEIRGYCDRQHALQADVYRRLDLSFDRFGRSSSPANHALTLHFFERLDAEGFVEERTIRQLWSPVDGRFLPDRYVLGTCPRCGHGDARGDQCDGCGATLDPTDLVDPRSAVSGDRDLELRETRHLFLRQSLLVPELEAWIERTAPSWPRLTAAIARAALADGVRDRCITRDLAWGVPVPRPGFEGKVFYVWFDAPIAYLAATAEWADETPGRDWRPWWQDEDVRRVQFLGKDNVPFHAVGFPSTLLGSRGPWRNADLIKGVAWVNYEGGKFSTSRRRGVFLDEALDLLPADPWRWWLAANNPETDDVDFSFSRFAEGVNSDLCDKYGNLVVRVLRFVLSAYGGAVPDGGTPGPLEERLAVEVEERLDALRSHHADASIRRATCEVRAIWDLANAYVAEAAPWSARRSDPDRAATATRHAVDLVRLASAAAWAFIPSTAERVLGSLGLSGTPPLVGLGKGTEVAAVRDVGIPFAKLDDAWVATQRDRFAGAARTCD